VIDPLTLLTFIPAALALNLTPGADMLFCLGQGLRGGPRAALAADAGIALGCMVHVGVAGLGLGALVDQNPAAFDAIRWAGVGYLLWLAIQTLRHPPGAGGLPRVSPARAFRQGLVVNLLNPKVILFVLALLPQFIDPSAPVLPQFLILGGVIATGGLIVNGAVGVFAGSLGARITRSPRIGVWLSRASAAIFVALAARLALISKG
jgi:threonine/homoserine/homoserine lactone efflux protein